MVESKGFFWRLRCLRVSSRDQELVKDPSVPKVAIDESQSSTNGADECMVIAEHPVSTEYLPRVSIEDTVEEALESARPESERQEEAVDSLVTEDIYDPFIMNLSPRATRPWGSSCDVKSRNDAEDSNGVATDASTEAPAKGETLDQSFFLYGVTLLRDTKRQDSTDGSASVADEQVTTANSAQEDVTSGRSPLSSIRDCQLVSHRISGDWANLNPRIYDALLQYFTGSELSSNQKVCKQWSDNVKLLMNNKSSKIVKAFKAAYGGQLEYESSYLICQPVFTAQKGMRIDLILRARANSWSTGSKNSLQYTYSYIPRNSCDEANGRNPVYANKFVFECLKRNAKRTVSYTRDISSVHGDDLHVAASDSMSQICEGDSIELPVVLMNALGNTNVESIKFMPLRREPSEGDVSSALDKMHREWYTVAPNSRYLRQLFPENIDAYSLVQPAKMQPHLKHQLTQVAGIDVITSRSTFVASTPGVVSEAKNFIGHTMEVVDGRQPIVCMLQRAGVQYDRLCHVQLRVGDNVRFYTTKG